MFADIVLSFYLGASQTAPSDLRVVQASRGNAATIHDVTWRGYPFRFEIYYGLRLTYTPPHYPFLSAALDFTHAKIYAETDNTVSQDGVWNGDLLRERAPMRDRVQSFEMTHGLNMLGISLLQQVMGQPGGGAYFGGGPVLFIPHTESRVDGAPRSSGYEFRGVGFQVSGGVRGCSGKTPLYAELKYSRGVPRVSIADGYAETVVRTLHELAGVGFAHCPRH